MFDWLINLRDFRTDQRWHEYVDVQSRLRTIATLLEGILAVLKDLDDKILALCAIEDVEHEIEESGEIELKIIECKDKIIRNQNKTKGETTSQTSAAVNDSATVA